MKYLITGVFAAGKSTIAEELIKRDLVVYDSDHTKGLSRWEDKYGKPVKSFPTPKNEGWYEDHGWNWNKKKLEDLLNSTESVFICGISSNQGKFYDVFDKIFLLVIDQKSVIDRLGHRRSNSDGDHHKQQLDSPSWQKSFEQDALSQGAISIDATQPLNIVVEEILSYTK